MALSLISKTWPIVMPTGRKFVLVALCDAANDDGACFLCIETIAYKCGMGIRTVQGHLTDLEASNLIHREERLGRSSIYSVNVVAIEDAEKHPFWVKRQMMKRTPAKSAGVHKTPAESAPIPVTKPSPTQKNINKKAACFLPIDFQPDETGLGLAADKGVSAEDSLEEFKDHHSAKGSVFIDWQAAFRTWVRNSAKFSGRGQRSQLLPAQTQKAMPMSFAQRDRIEGMQRWEESCNKRHPELPAEYSKFAQAASVIDITPDKVRLPK